MDRANKKFNTAATISIIVGVVTLITAIACGVLSIVTGAIVLSGKKELEI